MGSDWATAVVKRLQTRAQRENLRAIIVGRGLVIPKAGQDVSFYTAAHNRMRLSDAPTVGASLPSQEHEE